MTASNCVLTFNSGVEVRFCHPLDDKIANAFTALSDGSAAMDDALRSWGRDSAQFLAHQSDLLPNMTPRPALVGFKASAGNQVQFGQEENIPCRRMVFLMQALKAGVRGWGDPNGGCFFAFYRMTPEQWLKFCAALGIDAADPEKNQSSLLRVHLVIDEDSFSKFGPGIGF